MKKSWGFTLIELVVSIAILGLIFISVFPLIQLREYFFKKEAVSLMIKYLEDARFLAMVHKNTEWLVLKKTDKEMLALFSINNDQIREDAHWIAISRRLHWKFKDMDLIHVPIPILNYSLSSEKITAIAFDQRGIIVVPGSRERMFSIILETDQGKILHQIFFNSVSGIISVQ